MTISPERLSAFRNGFLCLTHSSCTTPELNKPPPPRSPPRAGRLETCRLGLGRCSATRVPHSRALAAPAQQAPGREGVEYALLAPPRAELRGKAPARVPSKPGRAAPPAGCVEAARRPPPEKPTGATARGAHRPSGRVEPLHDGWAARGRGSARSEMRRLRLGSSYCFTLSPRASLKFFFAASSSLTKVAIAPHLSARPQTSRPQRPATEKTTPRRLGLRRRRLLPPAPPLGARKTGVRFSAPPAFLKGKR